MTIRDSLIIDSNSSTTFVLKTLAHNNFGLNLNEECHTAKGKQTCRLFWDTTEISQLFYLAIKNVPAHSI
jgi:hypothetical protein